MPISSRLRSDERGATALEFALIFPVLALIIFGLIYGLLAAAAHVSLAHAASRGVRYASLAIDPVADVYPSTEQVEEYVEDRAPFFSADRCEASVAGEARANAPVTLDVSCEFPNPMGSALTGLAGFFGSEDQVYPDSLSMSARAEARRE